SGDGALLVSQGQDGAIRLWETATGKELRQFDPPKIGVTALALSADGKQLAVSAIDGTIQLRDTATGKEVRPLGKKPAPPPAVVGAGPVAAVPFVAGPTMAFSPDGKTLAVVGHDADDPKDALTIKLWETTTGKELRRIANKDADTSVLAPAFSPDGKLLA